MQFLKKQDLIYWAIASSLLVMASNYLFGAEQGVVSGGEIFRISIKVITIVIFFFCLGHIKLNFLMISLPLIFVAIFPLIFFSELDPAYRQATNLTLCLPLLFLDLRGIDFEQLMKKVIVLITVFHAILYFFAADIILFDNKAFVGSVGNPNSMGLIAIIVIFFSFIFHSKIHRFVIIALNSFFAIASGSLLASIYVVIGLFTRLKTINKIACVFIVLLTFQLLISFAAEIDEVQAIPSPIKHAVKKFNGLYSFLSNWGETVGAFSIDNRLTYFNDGLAKLNSFQSILLGHDNFSMIYFTGDGGFIGYAATHGVIISILLFCFFAICFLKGWLSVDPSRKASAWVVLFFTLSLFFNRTLDYWPMGIFLLIFLNVAYHNRYGDYSSTEN